MMTPNPAIPDSSEFVRSMPAQYARIFGESEIAEHSRLIGTRGGKSAHVALLRTLPRAVALVCVIADDVPGLLAHITGAFTALRMNVQSAQIFSRKLRDGRSEAVDFFWLRAALDAPLGPEDIERFGELLRRRLLDQKSTTVESSKPKLEAALDANAHVQFDAEARRLGESVLVVETDDCPGLLFAITSELHRQSVEVVASDVRTESGRVHDRFTLTSDDGRPLESAAAARVVEGVLRAVQSLGPRALRAK